MLIKMMNATKTMLTSGLLAGIIILLGLCLGQTEANSRHTYFLCPEVHCPSISPDCQMREIIVYQHSYRIRGRLVKIRCESCPYCLDLPWQSRSRGKRAVSSLYDVITDTQCPQIECPSVPENCSDVRLTDVFLRGRRCDVCPACYDNVFDRRDLTMP